MKMVPEAEIQRLNTIPERLLRVGRTMAEQLAIAEEGILKQGVASRAQEPRKSHHTAGYAIPARPIESPIG